MRSYLENLPLVRSVSSRLTNCTIRCLRTFSTLACRYMVRSPLNVTELEEGNNRVRALQTCHALEPRGNTVVGIYGEAS